MRPRIQRKGNATPKKKGRPIMEFDQEIADEFCQLYAHDACNTIQRICHRPEMPSYSTINRWLSENSAFSEQYARAREHRAEMLADEIISIADEAEGETDNAIVQAARLRVEARKWCASKLLPRTYGDKLETVNTTELTVRGSDPAIADKMVSFSFEGEPAEVPPTSH